MNAEHYQSAVLRRAGTKLREIHHHLQAGRVDLAKMRVGDLDREIRREAEELESMINAEMGGCEVNEHSPDSLVDTLTPISGCSYQYKQDGTCSHTDNGTPECHAIACPRLQNFNAEMAGRDSGRSADSLVVEDMEYDQAKEYLELKGYAVRPITLPSNTGCDCDGGHIEARDPDSRVTHYEPCPKCNKDFAGSTKEIRQEDSL